jgi:hypothetical protein
MASRVSECVHVLTAVLAQLLANPRARQLIKKGQFKGVDGARVADSVLIARMTLSVPMNAQQ